jgi:hypothetical protein
MAVLSVILGDQFGQNLAAPVPGIRPINAGRRNEDDLVDAGGSGRPENLEGAAHIEVEEVVGVFLAAIYVDTVPLDSFVVPTAFGSKEDPTEYVSVVVHFPITLEAFTFLSTIYIGGVSERYQDLPLYPHTWLHLTVTNGAGNRFVIVHFDALTTNGQRLFVAEGPASTDVGGRFLDQSITRMQEMLSQEAAQSGSSGNWGTEFYYDDPDTGVIVVAVTGERGVFDAAYEIQTPTQKVKQHSKTTAD